METIVETVEMKEASGVKEEPLALPRPIFERSEEEALEIALALRSVELTEVSNFLRTWEQTILRLTLETWKPVEIADMIGVEVREINTLMARPSFLIEYSKRVRQADSRSISLRKRVDGMAHQALDNKARILGMEPDENDHKMLTVQDRVNDSILDRQGTIPRHSKVEREIHGELTIAQIHEINANADQLNLDDVMDAEIIDSNPIDALYEDAPQLLEKAKEQNG